MRITLSIDDDVFAAVKELAAMQGKGVGAVTSSLAREALRPKRSTKRTRNGVPLLPLRPGSKSVTLELVNQLRDALI
jgi:hypothetical protein